MATRPTLTKITLTYEVDGQTFTKDVDPTQAEGLFWTDHSVQHLLASYYRPDHPGQPKTPGISEASVMNAWNTPLATGHLPVVMDKAPACSANPVC